MTKVSKRTSENQFSYVIVVEAPKEDFTIPVIDVRDGEKARQRANGMLKAVNISKGSKYFNPSYSVWGFTYNHSMKK